jgi:hypothetical protein
MDKGQDLLDYLDAMVKKDKENVQEYEGFHRDKLKDVRNLDPMDSFLYGIATGKLDRSISIRDLMKDLIYRFGKH